MDPLTIALAIYGGYQGYSSAKKAHANTLGQIFGAAAGAYGGYSLGTGVGGLLNAGGETALENSAVNAGVTGGINAFTDQSLQNVGTAGITANAPSAAYGEIANEVPVGGIKSFSVYPEFQTLNTPSVMNASYTTPMGEVQPAGFDTKGYSVLDSEANNRRLAEELAKEKATSTADLRTARGIDSVYDTGVNTMEGADRAAKVYQKTLGDQALDYGKKGYSYLFEKTNPQTLEKELDLGKAALIGVPTALYASGAFERKPYERNLFTYNVNYPDLYRGRTFQVQDPKTGKVYDMPQQTYIPEEKAKEGITSPSQQFGPYRRETLTLREGGLASLAHFKDGGVSYLPTKSYNDETDEKNYIRVNGYIEDAAGTADKNEDTMLAQLADGEFVTRTDGVLGAGILAGANLDDEKQMRKMGADFFYEQQKRFKRIFDLLDASRKATQH